MLTKPVKGSCLCKTVQYEIFGHLGIFQYCHCSRCRKISGSAFAANIIVAPEQFRWLCGEDSVERYELPEAKHFASCFCSSCGSSLPWMAQTGKAVIVPAGTLDDDPQIRPHQNLFCSNDAAWYVEPGQLTRYDEMPPRKKK